MLPKIVTSLKQTLGSPAAMEDLEAAIDQEFAKAADRRTRATGIQNSMRPAKPGPSEPDDPNGDRPPSTMAEWNQRLERFCKTRVPHQVANLKVAIHILKRENRRFKTEELLKLDPSLSEGPLKQALAAATKEGVLTNRSDKKPRGYGLPEWDWRCREYVPEYVLTNPNEIGGDESTNLSTY